MLPTHTEKKGKGAEGGSGFDEQRTALFVAEGILRCRLSPETFITPRRLLGITNVFDENDVDVPAVTFPREPALRRIGNSYGQRSQPSSTFRHLFRFFPLPED